VWEGCSLSLLHIAQCCFTMLYILEQTFLIDVSQLMEEHVQKLKLKGYVLS
jgi:hypothetical protein